MRARFRVLSEKLLNRSPFLSPKSAWRSLLKVMEAFVWRIRQQKCRLSRDGKFKTWTAELARVGLGFTKQPQKMMFDHLDNCEVLKVNTRELEFHVLAPNEPTVDIEHIVMQARGEGHQRVFQGANFGTTGGTSKNVHHTGKETPRALPGD